MTSATLAATRVDRVPGIGYGQLSQTTVAMARHATFDGIALMLAGATEPLGVATDGDAAVQAAGRVVQ